MGMFKHKIVWFILAVGILAVDQASKLWVVGYLQEGQIASFLPFFNFTLVYNPGAAFSFLSDAGGWQRWFLGVLALAVSVLLIVWILRLRRDKKLELAGLSLILGGAAGNLWDRLYLGKVVDFIDWFYVSAGECLPLFYPGTHQTCHWPSFNIADSAILLGVALLLVDMFVNGKQKEENV